MSLLDSFIDYLRLEKKYSKHTLMAYKKDVEDFKKFLLKEFTQEDLLNINYSQVRSWIGSLVNSGLTNRTINRKLSSLKSFYNYLQKIDALKVSPLKKHKSLKIKKKVQVPFSQTEIQTVLQDCNQDSFLHLRDKLIMELFYSTGIRRIELINIKLQDINLQDRTLKVLGKRNKERVIPLIDSVINTIRKYLEFRSDINPKNNYLFLTKKGVKVYETLVYRIINSYFSAVSIKVKKSPHILRHTFATHLLNEGANLNSVKELLGHSSLASTQVYTHNSLGVLKKVYNRAHPRSQKKDTK